MIIRNAVENDIKELTYIYNYEVINGTSTFDIEPQSHDERKKWFNLHGTNRHPLIVSEESGIVTGYASLSPYRNKDAYSTTAELSLYVHPKYRGCKTATALVTDIISRAKNEPTLKLIISVITSGNEASINLHKKFGFIYCGSIPNVAYKNGKALGTDFYILNVD